MATGGASEFVAPGESVEPAVRKMVARLRAPSMSGVSLAWPDGVLPTWVSALPISIFGGDTVCVFAGLPEPCAGELRLMAIPQGHVVPQTLARASLLGSQGSSDALPRVAAHNRSMLLHDMATTVSEAESLQVALDYQLITDQTNFLLVHRRSEGELPNAMPELLQVAPMLSAGWGGTGSVLGSLLKTRPIFECRVIDYAVGEALDWSGWEEAAVPRPAPNDSISFCQSFQPAPTDAKATAPSIDRRDPLLWSADGVLPGLTPRGLMSWLCSTPAADWPASYAGLIEIGVNSGVIDWLRASFGLGVDDATEKSVVRALLDAMVTMIERLGIGPEVRGDKQSVIAVPPASELGAAVLAALRGMTAQDWGFTAQRQLRAMTQASQEAGE